MRTAARLSLSVKYQWPEAAWVKLEISPRTHSDGMLRSSNWPTAWFNWATVRISRANTSFVTDNPIVIRVSEPIYVHRPYAAGPHHNRTAAPPPGCPQRQQIPCKSLFLH
ncbi:Uncharacterised protein [Bordetella pertussis]|nr:Uncharacterised protein [Bordetella pertussis]